MRQVVILCSFVFLCQSIYAQKYLTAAGIRLGTGIGLTVQQSIGEHRTIEGIIQKGFFNDLTTITALFEKHQKIISKATNFYIGAGPHIGLYPSNSAKSAYRKNAYGATFIGGVEFTFNKLLLSFDYKPALNIVGGENFFDSQAAVSLRYIIFKPAKKEQKWQFWKKKNQQKNKS